MPECTPGCELFSAGARAVADRAALASGSLEGRAEGAGKLAGFSEAIGEATGALTAGTDASSGTLGDSFSAVTALAGAAGRSCRPGDIK